MKKILTLFIVFIITLISTVNLFAKTESGHPFEEYKLDLTKDELLFIKELQKETINVASYSNSESNLFMLRNIEETFGFSFNYVEFDNFGKALKAVEEGSVKLISQVTYTYDRAKVLAFSRAANITHAQIFANDFRLFERIDTAFIGVETGTIWKSFITNAYPNITTVEFDTMEEGIELLNTGVIDGVIAGDKFYDDFISIGKYPVDISHKLEVSATSLAGTKNEMELFLSAFSKYSKTPEFEDAVTKFYDFYYKSSNEAYLQTLLKDKNFTKPIKIGISSLPPFSDKVRGEFSGILPDVLKESLASAGISYETVAITDNSLKTAEKMLLNGEIDLMVPAIDTVDKRESMLFLESRFVDNSIIVKRKYYGEKIFNNISDLGHENIGLVEGSIYVDYFSNAFPLMEFEIYPNEMALIQGLKSKEVDIIPLFEKTFLEYINASNDFSIEKTSTINNFLDVSITAAAQNTPDGALLIDIINAAYRTINSSDIFANYYNPMDYELYYKSQKQNFDLIISTLIIILFLTVLLTLKLYKLSRTDTLCNIYNREALVRDYKNGIRENETVILFDINNFKEFNDLYGHSVGDEVLKSFVNSYKGDERFKMYRLGGDEFIVIEDFSKKKITLDEYVNLFLYKNVNSKVADCSYTITSSIGILPGKYGIGDLEKTLSIVDIALYEAKKLQNSKTFINKEKLEEYKEKIEFRKHLKNAVKNNEIYAKFQPIFNLNNHQIVGVEVFSRWSLNASFVPTKTYVDMAKLLGVEGDIDLISLKYAGMLYNQLKSNNIIDDNFKFHINISEQTLRQFDNNDYNVEDYGLKKQSLVLEIKESLFSNNRCNSIVKNVIKNGYKVSIDNYLTCNSSPKNIRSNLIPTIKVDGLMLKDSYDDKLFVKSQVDMLNTLNKQVSAQTIEQKWQLSYFKSLNVTEGQGYYFCKPLELEDMFNFIKKNYNKSIK